MMLNLVLNYLLKLIIVEAVVQSVELVSIVEAVD